MRPRWTRRGFLGLTVGGSLVSRRSPADGPEAAETVAAQSAAASFAPGRRVELQAFMDVLIPAGDGMPAASEAGALAYLETLAAEAPQAIAELLDCLNAVDRVARGRFGTSFTELAADRRARIVAEVERDESASFRSARDLVYEAYYTRPEVWRRLGYEFRSGDGPAPPLDPFDEKLLERVKGMGELYRKAP